MELNVLTGEVIGAAIEVHRELGGPGLLEEVYEAAMAHELSLRGLVVERQVAVPVLYKGCKIKKAHFLDLLVVEVKSVEKHNPLHEAQLLTYLRVSHRKLGLLVNFGERYVAQGVRRVANGLP